MEGVGHCIMLYNPMSHGAHTSLYNPMTHGAHALLYNPMTHGDLYPLYNVVWPHDPWGFVTIAAPMTHGEKVAEGAHYRRSLQNNFINKTEGNVGKEPAKHRCFHKHRLNWIAGR